MRVLIAEDDPMSRRLLAAILAKWGYDVVPCADGAEAWTALQFDDAPRIALLDWMMPGLDGPQVCREVRRLARDAYTYIVLLTAKSGKEDLIEGMDAGADDYVGKPFDPHELQVRLRAGQRVVELHEQLLATREELRTQATHDGLTGLWNRGAILEILDKELARACRTSAPLAILMADLDHFKHINDTHGHAAGDTVLREVARRLTASLRPYDSVGRVGGEEFLLILPGCDAATAASVAERVRSGIAAAPIAIAEEATQLTVSVGVACRAQDGSEDGEALVRASDVALYEAKRAGRNRFATAAREPASAQQELRPPKMAQQELRPPA